MTKEATKETAGSKVFDRSRAMSANDRRRYESALIEAKDCGLGPDGAKAIALKAVLSGVVVKELAAAAKRAETAMVQQLHQERAALVAERAAPSQQLDGGSQ